MQKPGKSNEERGLEDPPVMSEDKTPLIYQAINRIMDEVGFIGKDHKAGDGNFSFKFRGIDDIYNSLHGLFAKHGIFVKNKILDMSNEIEVVQRWNKFEKMMKDSMQHHVTIRMSYTFVALDGSTVETQAPGEGIDSNDKAYAKAQSNAFKYALFQIFCIPTQDELDNEIENNDQDQQKVTIKQAEEMKNETQVFMDSLDGATSSEELSELWLKIPSKYRGPIDNKKNRLKSAFKEMEKEEDERTLG